MSRDRSSFFLRLLKLRVLLVVNVLILGFVMLSVGREVVRNHEINKEIEVLKEQAASLEDRHLEITNLHTALQTESFIEREARLKLGLKRPGEQLIVVQEAEAATIDQAPVSESGSSEDLAGSIQQMQPASFVANPTKWWYYFFDREQFDALTYEK